MQKRIAIVFALILLLSLLCGCKDDDDPTIDVSSTTNPALTTTESGGEAGPTGSAETETTTKDSGGKTKKTTAGGSTTAATTKSNTYYAPQVKTNSAPGTKVETFSDGTVIDYSNTSSGYVMLKYSGAYPNVRARVVTPKSTNQDYPIFSTDYVALPLTSGNGTYKIMVLANDGNSTSYAVTGQLEISVSISSSNEPFLRPNVFVDYTSSTACVNKAAELTRGCDTELTKVEAIFNYVVNNFTYDKAKASTVAAKAYIPDLASIWSAKSGICFDYASTMAAMLRTQGIPTKVCAGQVKQSSGTVYHAWLSVYTKEKGWVDGIIQFDGSSWKFMDPTFASSGGNTLDWTKKYTYTAQYYY